MFQFSCVNLPITQLFSTDIGVFLSFQIFLSVLLASLPPVFTSTVGSKFGLRIKVGIDINNLVTALS